jgi:hypothetical protein
MPVLGRRGRRRRPSPAAAVRPRGTVVVELPEAPGAASRPAPLALPIAAGRGPWALPRDPERRGALAAFLAVIDVAPPGGVLDVASGAGEHALLAAVYSARPVRAVEADATRAHSARQAAASNALGVVIEELRLDGPGAGRDGETLDDYVERRAIAPVVVRLGVGADPGSVLTGGLTTLRRRRPWLVLGSADQAAATLRRLPEMVALRYQLITETGADGPSRGYVLAPEAVPTAFRRRLEAWSAALTATAPGPVTTAGGPGREPAPSVGALRGAQGAGTTS